MEFLDAFEAEKLTKQKWEQYCETPCRKDQFKLQLCFKNYDLLSLALKN